MQHYTSANICLAKGGVGGTPDHDLFGVGDGLRGAEVIAVDGVYGIGLGLGGVRGGDYVACMNIFLMCRLGIIRSIDAW